MSTLTFDQVIAEIVSRLNRDDLDGNGITVARDFAADRINYYAKEVFYTGQVLDTSISTVKGTTFYNFPTGFEEITSIRVLNGNNWIPLGKDTHENLQFIDVLSPPVESLPARWAPFAAQFRLYPTPGTVYSLELSMNIPPTPPLAASSNFWTMDAQSLTINGTCAEIADLYLNDPVRTARFRTAEERERRSLVSKTIRLGGGIQTVPYL